MVLPYETCEFIQESVEQNNGKEGGVRGLKMCIRIIIDKLSLLLNTTEEERKELNLSFNVDIKDKPIIINEKIVRELYKLNEKKVVWKNMYV